MRQAWHEQMLKEAAFIDASEKAPAFFKPEAVEDAKERYYSAMRNLGVWE